MSEYKHDLNECDVTDKVQLTRFREKRSEWFGWLENDEHHNVRAQIHSLMWNDVVFRLLNEAREFSSDDNPSAATNRSLCDFVSVGYISAQILGICKIMGGRKDVISLRRLFDDIVQNRNLLTREHFVSFDGLPYDFAAVQNEQFDRLSDKERREVRWIATTGPEAWGTSELAHLAFDKLSNVAADNRKRTDLIHQRMFDDIQVWFEAPILDRFQALRHKFVAHAADELSRQARPLDRLGFSLDEIREAQYTVVRIATAVGSYILHGSALGGVVPTPQFDVFEKLNMPFVPANNMQEMREWWHRHEAEREGWLEDPFGVPEK